MGRHKARLPMRVPFFSSKNTCGEAEMKNILISGSVAIPDDIKLSVKRRMVTVTGKRGTLTKSFRHMSIELTKLSSKKLRIDMWFTTRKQAAYMRTVIGHIKNMFKGVTYGYLFKMKAVYAHFPINISTSEENSLVEIRNFLGEKYTRKVNMRKGVTCCSTGTKDEIKVEGNDLELVSQSAALIHQSVMVKRKDIRKFLDGIYVSEKTTVDPMDV